MTEKTSTGLRINLKRVLDESYEVEFGVNLFPRIADYLLETGKASKHAIITDSNVHIHHARRLEEVLAQKGVRGVETFAFPAGEGYKHLDTCRRIINKMSEHGFARDSYVLALGGGVVGDMAGFISSIFNRGVPYIQIPTTILSQADSAVGGKTGVDGIAKNSVGLIVQPKRVFVDAATISTLPQKEYINGLAETIKHGVILDVDFFEYLEKNMKSILSGSTREILYIAEQNCKLKGAVVELDPNELGLRRILNYGHTPGHAVEKLSNFTIPHGECVSIGMMVAGRIANQLGYFANQDLQRQENVLVESGLPVKLPNSIKNEDIIAITALDKKSASGKARYCLPSGLGKMQEFDGSYVTPVDNSIVLNALNQTR